jgi:hypothetical protein
MLILFMNEFKEYGNITIVNDDDKLTKKTKLKELYFQ